MCHQTVRPTPAPGPEAPGAPPTGHEEPDPAGAEGEEAEGVGDQDLQSEPAGDVSPEQQENADADQEKASPGLRFSSSGDFVGFAGGSPGDFPPPHELQDETFHPRLKQSTCEAVNGEAAVNAELMPQNSESCDDFPQMQKSSPQTLENQNSWVKNSDPQTCNDNTYSDLQGLEDNQSGVSDAPSSCTSTETVD